MAEALQEKHESAHLLEGHETESTKSSFDLDEQAETQEMFSAAGGSQRPLPGSKWNTASGLLRTQTIVYFLFRALVWLLPSFIGDSLLPGKHPGIAAKTRPTAFLDGMRGVASWFVFNTHLTAVLSKNSGAAWGHDGHNYEFFRLPIVRLIYSGHGAVRLFFVISGFALSIGPITKMNKAQFDEAAAFRGFCSSTFRRPLRLFLPAFASTIPIFFMIRLDMFTKARALIVDDNIVPGWEYLDRYPARTASLWAQLLNLYESNRGLLQIFNNYLGRSFSNPYNEVLWTITLEFRASLMLFLAHAALYYMTRPFRICTVAILIWFSILCDSFEMPLFFAGHLLAECWLTPNTSSHLPSSSGGDTPSPRRRFLVQGVCWVTFVISAFIASTPSWQVDHVPAFAWLQPYAPFGYDSVGFWSSLGAVGLVATIGQLPPLNAFFSSPVIRYLGKISFSFYLVHLVLVRCVGRLIYYYIWGATGKDNGVITFFGFVLAYFLTIGLVIWTADIFWRMIENPTVDFAKWAESKLFRSR